MWHTRTDRIVEEIVHGHEVVPIRLRAQVLRGEAGAPDLSIQRSTRVEGSTRGLVILVHGFAQNRFTWRISRRSFSGFLAQAGYDVLNVELRGHGRSGHAGAGVFTEYVEDVVRVVDALDGKTPFVIGHSLGAGVAVGVAVQRPLRGVIHLAGVYDFASTNPALQTFAKRARRVAAWMSGSPARVRTRWIGQLLGRTYRVSDLAGYALPISGWAPGSIERDLLEERLRKGFDWTSLEIWAQLSR
jgi:polyhydroxyalkanoate synthase